MGVQQRRQGMLAVSCHNPCKAHKTPNVYSTTTLHKPPNHQTTTSREASSQPNTTYRFGKLWAGQGSALICRAPQRLGSGLVERKAPQCAQVSTASWLEEQGLGLMMGGHCTGIAAAETIARHLKLPRSQISHAAIGSVITPELTIIRSSVE